MATCDWFSSVVEPQLWLVSFGQDCLSAVSGWSPSAEALSGPCNSTLAGIIVGRATLFLLGSHCRAIGLMGWEVQCVEEHGGAGLPTRRKGHLNLPGWAERGPEDMEKLSRPASQQSLPLPERQQCVTTAGPSSPGRHAGKHLRAEIHGKVLVGAGCLACTASFLAKLSCG